ncbi:MAG TPA: MFS transporter [Gemmatimonadales bacterium]
MKPSPAAIIRIYLAITGLFSLAMSLIWGIDTLFKMRAGLDILEVMLTNAAFTLGMMVFEIPTGVVADTVGRRASLLLCLGTLFVTTLAYAAIPRLGFGFGAFAAVSVLLGLGYTFYTGAVEAWLVDALKSVGHEGPLETVFARSHTVFGLAMLVGTVGGGLLGQLDLALPYVVRAAVVIPLFVLAWRSMRDLGYTPRALELRRVPAEMRGVFVEGMRYALPHPVVRPLMLASLVSMSFMIFGFYSWQRYFLDLLGRELVWVSGVIAALGALAMVAGNSLVARVSKVIPDRATVLAWATVVGAVLVVVAGVVGGGVWGGPPPSWAFWAAVTSYLLSDVALGVAMPLKQAFMNEHIPSAQRATIISLDSFFANAGGVVGQWGWGSLAKARSIADAWVYAGLTQLFAVPLYWLARRAARPSVEQRPYERGSG